MIDEVTVRQSKDRSFKLASARRTVAAGLGWPWTTGIGTQLNATQRIIMENRERKTDAENRVVGLPLNGSEMNIVVLEDFFVK